MILFILMSSLIHTSLNDIEITDLLNYYNKPCHFVAYEDMYKIKDLKTLLPRTLILYELQEVGHFCCVFINKYGLNFYDPLGYRIDDELKLVRSDLIHSKHQDFTYLLNLFRQSPFPIIWNNHRLQQHHTSTCGHWCTVRLLWDNLGEEEFYKCFKGVKDKDKIVARIFYEFQNRMKKIM